MTQWEGAAESADEDYFQDWDDGCDLSSAEGSASGLVEGDIRRHAEALEGRVRKRYRHWRRRFEREGTGVFRLYDWDVPEVRAVVDWYDGHATVAEYARRQSDVAGYLDALVAAVARATDVPVEHVHPRRRRTGRERYERFSSESLRHVVREQGLRFIVNLTDYVDTGLFADHRLTRRLVEGMSEGKRVLNLYGYTGAFTCYAARGGAAETFTIDQSGTYLDWAKENLELNGLHAARHRLLRAEAKEWLEAAHERGELFDVIVLDPPSRSTLGGFRGGNFDILRDHSPLLDVTSELLAPGGQLVFSTNHQRFELRWRAASELHVEEVTRRTVPEDYRNRRVHRCWLIQRP